MSTATPRLNPGILDSLRTRQATERQQAEETYWQILREPARRTPADQDNLRNAMRVLGITDQQARLDLQAIAESHKLAADAHGPAEAQQALEDAIATLKQWWEVTRVETLNALAAKEAQLRQAKTAAEAELARRMTALHQLRRHRIKHGERLADHLAPDPDGAPAVVRINGILAEHVSGI